MTNTTTSSNFKLKFNITISNYKKLQSAETTITFLAKCQKEKIIPNTFVIPLKLQQLNPIEEKIAKNVLKQTSRTLLKLALKSKRTEAIKLNTLYWESWHQLINTKQSTEQDELIEQIRKLENNIRHKLTVNSQKKFAWLKRTKANKPMNEQTN
jgi:hypothetical protein